MAFDRTIAAAALVVLSPVLAAAAVGVKRSSLGPVLFRQTRVGRDGQPFTLLKFRSMRIDAGGDQRLREQITAELAGTSTAVDQSYKLAADPRITRFGALLRKTSIDELPQFINVLRGEMALVGPRPALPWEHELFSDEHKRRVLVEPGITGLWQVSGRSTLSTLEMLELDVEYVARRSFRYDLSILLRTPLVLVRGDGAR